MELQETQNKMKKINIIFFLFISTTVFAKQIKSTKSVCENVADHILKQQGYSSFQKQTQGKIISDAFTYIFSLPDKDTIRIGYHDSSLQHSFVSVTNEKLNKTRTIFLDQNCKITSVTDEAKGHTTNQFTAALCNLINKNHEGKKSNADIDRKFVMQYVKDKNHRDIIIDKQNIDSVLNFCSTFKNELHQYEVKQSIQVQSGKPTSIHNNKAH